ncbi:acetoin utilization protein AcuC [Luteococcus sp. Sow4_B9]|uniref:acetoin utilization protein AcuC n=1 Tax=Luteococcus sp. Sow4_B9 TaxID=3438792 RepID=UPI003F94C49B
MSAPTLPPAAPPGTRPVLVHDGVLTEYSFGDTHPMGPDRVRLAIELADHCGVLDQYDLVAPREPSDDLLRLVHSDEYVQALHDGQEHPELGIGGEDNPVVPGLPDVASRIAAATTTAAELVWTGRARRAVNVSGGLHHAMPAQAAGFCLYNDAAVAIAWLLDQGAQRVAYLDLDAHHGDGVEQAFWNDPRVLTISVHETGLHLFPGTGFAHEIGGPDAFGTAVNVPLPPDACDLQWLRAMNAVVPPLLGAFRPQILVTQHGADPHRSDPLTHLPITMDAMSISMRQVGVWAERYAGGRWVAVGGGGYRRDAAARAWTHLLAEVAGTPVDPTMPTPKDWASRLRDEGCPTMGDPDATISTSILTTDKIYPDEPDPALVATSRAVFPWWGLQPYH